MITKVYVTVIGQNRQFDVRYASNRVKDYTNKIPNTVRKFINTTPFTTKTVIIDGKQVDYFTFEA